MNQRLDEKAFKKIENMDITGGTPLIVKKLSNFLQDDLNHLDQIRQKNRLSVFNILSVDKNNFNKINELLSTVISAPNLNGMEECIMAVLSEKGRERVNKIRTLFSDSRTEYCPTCFREITDNEKEELVQTISQVLDISKKDAEDNLVNQLKSLILNEENPINKESELALLFPKEVTAYNEVIDTYNAMITEYSKAILNKIDNPYVVPRVSEYNEQEIYSTINSTGRAIQDAVENYNNIFKDEQLIKEDADFLNLNIAKFNNRNLFDQFEQATLEHHILKQKLDEVQLPLEKIEKKISNIKLQLAGQKIALDQINTRLAHVFMDRERLTLVEGDNCYRIQSRGEFIATSQLSVGERNAISICYFFSRINANIQASKAFKRSIFVVLDDPISSFDFENKIGILSLIREELEKILLGDPDSKVLVMTHDAEMFRHVAKIYDDIEERRNLLSKSEGTSIQKIISHHYQLSSGKLTSIGTKYFNDYAQQLKVVYDYASSDATKSNVGDEGVEEDYQRDDVYIGNVMRRVIEAFSTFCYQRSTSAIFNDIDIMNQIPAEHRNFIRTFMYRLVLNSESHSVENIMSRPDSNSIDFISHTELIKTAKLLIVFMNDLNSLHLKKLINGFDVRVVKSWAEIVV
ncbi:AAA family ATPase [Latilactobacillus sakei]|uniref:AAA family ATPase n=1 Tax=Latilactobacillus sakei TaxID=1599 RepID=UPI003887B7C4